MRRREAMAAIATIMAAGCTDRTNADDKTKTAMNKFSEITEFEAPDEDTIDHAVRFVDEKYGVVFYAFRHSAAMTGDSSQLEIVTDDIR